MDGLSLIVSLAIGGAGVVALLIALGASDRAHRLAARILALERQNKDLWAQIDRLHAAVAQSNTGSTGNPAERAGPAATRVTAAEPDRSGSGRAQVAASAVGAAPARAASPPVTVAAARASSAPAVAPVQAQGTVPVAPPRPAVRQPGFEERIGSRWTVWVGGLALALGALLLVRYSIEQGYFGPPMRIALAALLSGAMVAGGEWLRRTQRTIRIDAMPEANIPAVLTAAGTVGGFGTVYAAHALYGFVGASFAFVLLGAIALAALAAAAVHGPALAGLGLAGSLLTPLLVSSNNPSPWPVVMFLAVVGAAAYGLAHRRNWQWLANAAAAGGVLWSLVFAAGSANGSMHISAAMAHTLVQLWLAVATMHWRPVTAGPDASAAGPSEPGTTADSATNRGQHLWVNQLLMLTGFALTSVLVLAGAGGLSTAFVIFAALVIATLSATAVREASLAPASLLAGVVALGAMAVWPEAGAGGTPVTVHALPWITPVWQGLYLVFALGAAGVIAVPAGLRLWRTSALDSVNAAMYASAATIVPLCLLTLADARIAHFEPSLTFALAGFALAAVFGVTAVGFEAGHKQAPAAVLNLATGSFATATAAAAALGFGLYLTRGPLTVALAVTVYAAAVVAADRNIAVLRQGAAALGLLVLARVFHDPYILRGDAGTWPVLNWLLVGYGVPALAFWGAARTLGREGATDLPQRLCEALGIVFAALLAFFEIRHFMNHGDILAPTTDHAEQGLFALTGFLFTYALMVSGVSTANAVFRVASYTFGVISAAVTLVSLGLIHNPLYSHEPVYGSGPANSLLLGYLLPAAAAAVVTRASRTRWPVEAVWVSAACALGLLFAYVTLEVRHLFQGADLWAGRPTGDAELWVYSAAWLMLGIGLLAYGVMRDAVDVRLASAIVVFVTVFKVFLFDLSGLEGIWRAMSFIGLGLVLLGIGLVYQRVLASPREAPGPAA